MDTPGVTNIGVYDWQECLEYWSFVLGISEEMIIADLEDFTDYEIIEKGAIDSVFFDLMESSLCQDIIILMGWEIIHGESGYRAYFKNY